MLKLIEKLIIVFCCSNVITYAHAKGLPSKELNNIYHQGQREYHRSNYKAALPLLEKYLKDSKSKTYKKERLFWVIDQIGRIYLRVKKDPDAAIRFFENILKDERLSEAEEEDIASWIAAAKDWKKFSKLSSEKSSPKNLFVAGKNFYISGKKKKAFEADDAGNADFVIAKTFLVPLVVNHDQFDKIGQALYMLGDIQRNLRTDSEYWDDNYYLKETIRRNPHSDLAEKAWRTLKEDIELGYTGSGGTNIPPSLLNMLSNYWKLAEKKKKNKM